MSQPTNSEMLLFAPEPPPEFFDSPPTTAAFESIEPEGIIAGTEELTHGQVVERIMRLNSSATLEFLAPFTTPMLRNYMDHLVTALEPRSGKSRWARRADSPAILSSESGL